MEPVNPDGWRPHAEASVCPVETDEIQGIVASGYSRYRHALYLILHVRDAEATRKWLNGLLPEIQKTSAKRVLRARASARPSRHVQAMIAWTAAGLRAIGVDEEALTTFSPEFYGGMTQSFRARGLGDTGGEDAPTPENWRWGAAPEESEEGDIDGEEPKSCGRGAAPGEVHVLLGLFSAKPEAVAWPEVRDRWIPESSGVGLVDAIEATLEGTEPFGFRDGISQPRLPWESSETQPRERRWRNTVALGEFVLGYRNELGKMPASPWIDAERYRKIRLDDDVPLGDVSFENLPEEPGEGSPVAPPTSHRRDLGRNGTYLVVRELEQNVAEFKKLSEEQAAKIVGRWQDGTPLVLSPNAPVPGLTTENDFAYHTTDRAGLACPLGSHVRRSNPRDSLADPDQGVDPEDAVASANLHRILRRGRTFHRGEGEARRVGMMFICINANIEQQFEFVQKQWLQNSGFSGLADERDPLVGLRDPSSRFSIPKATRTESVSLGKYVRVRGGAYFFLPSLSALRFLAEGLPPRPEREASGSGIGSA